MLAVLPGLREADVAAVQPARELEPPVPAARRLAEVAADRPHRAELRRGGLRARLAQRGGDLRVDLELGERRAGADPRAVDPARHRVGQVDERVRVDDPVAEERDEVGAAGERDRAVPERRDRLRGVRRAPQLHAALARAPPRARAAAPPA